MVSSIKWNRVPVLLAPSSNVLFLQSCNVLFLDKWRAEMMGIEMSEKAVKRHEVLSLVEAGAILQKEGARLLEVTARQMRRIVKRFRQEGARGLNSKRYGLKPGNAISEAVRQRILECAASRYQGFGPTLLAEKLVEEQGMTLSVESVRQTLMAGGYWRAKQGGEVKRHPLRERRPRFGELIQIDGSPHDWFEGRSLVCTLLVFIDDATGQLTQLRFMPTETTLGYMHCLHDHILAHGMPMALYSDRHSIFRVNGEHEGETQWGRAMDTLGIEQICANSPQAKGRVERVNQTLQDRLVKEMRLLGINGPEEANAWLPQYVTGFNARFSVTAAQPEDAHVPWIKDAAALREVLSQHEERTLSKELTLSYNSRCLQVVSAGSGRGLRRAKVKIHEHFDGALEVRRQGRNFAYREIAKPTRQGKVVGAKDINNHLNAIQTKRRAHKPVADHPWRGARGEGAPLRASGLRPTPSVPPLPPASAKANSKPTARLTATS